MRDEVEAILSAEMSGANIPRPRQIFVNRNLHLGHVDWIGFDLDYTLANYDKKAIETAAFEITRDKLVDEKGYPEEVSRLEYSPDFVIRGLVVDKERGNILKLDRYAYVKLAYHGRRRLPRAERKRVYSLKKLSFGAQQVMALDTLFALPEACLFADLIGLSGGGDSAYPSSREAMYDDIREMIDKAHRDGTLKRRVRANLGRFFHHDRELAATLHKLREGGKRLFLLTNSYWDYTDAVLSHLLDDELAAYGSWRDYFDCIVVGARKPDFHTSNNPFLRVDVATGMLNNVDSDELRLGEVYQGGCAALLEMMLEASGEKVLYFGDHIYGDILRSKKSRGWRTGLVIEELEREVEILDNRKSHLFNMDRVDRARRRLEDQRDGLLWQASDPDDVAKLDARIAALQRHAGTLFRRTQGSFNQYWGELFRAGKEVSLFGHQVEDYACLYTSRVSNFLYYPVDRYFRCRRGGIPHDPNNDEAASEV